MPRDGSRHQQQAVGTSTSSMDWKEAKQGHVAFVIEAITKTKKTQWRKNRL